MPTRGLLAVETMHAIVQRLVNLNIKRNMTSMFVNKKHRYNIMGDQVLRIRSNKVSAQRNFTYIAYGSRRECMARRAVLWSLQLILPCRKRHIKLIRIISVR